MDSYMAPLSETKPTIHDRFEHMVLSDDVILEHILSIKTNSPVEQARASCERPNMPSQDQHI